jgi:hypothetical protein
MRDTMRGSMRARTRTHRHSPDTTLPFLLDCIGWSFAFPSYAEELLWRIASISVTSVPVPLAYVVLMSMDRPGRFGLTLAGSILYLIGRLILLVLPFMSLRSLPAEAYQTVEWTTFIPHV